MCSSDGRVCETAEGEEREGLPKYAESSAVHLRSRAGASVRHRSSLVSGCERRVNRPFRPHRIRISSFHLILHIVCERTLNIDMQILVCHIDVCVDSVGNHIFMLFRLRVLLLLLVIIIINNIPNFVLSSLFNVI